MAIAETFVYAPARMANEASRSQLYKEVKHSLTSKGVQTDNILWQE